MWVVAVFVGVLFHEFGHASAMRAYGFYPWITLYGMGGMASYHPGSYSPRGAVRWRRFSFPPPGPWPASCWPP